MWLYFLMGNSNELRPNSLILLDKVTVSFLKGNCGIVHHTYIVVHAVSQVVVFQFVFSHDGFTNALEDITCKFSIEILGIRRPIDSFDTVVRKTRRCSKQLGNRECYCRKS